MNGSQLREGDADQMMRVIADAHHDDPGAGMPWALLEGLAQLIPSDSISYQHHDVAGRSTLAIQGVDDALTRSGPDRDTLPTEEESEPFWDLFWQAPCSWPQRSGDLRTVIMLTDFLPTRREQLADPMLREVHTDVRHELMLSLPAEPRHARRIIFVRTDDAPFTERDRQVVSLMRPYVHELWLDAERRRGAAPRLSSREWEVLVLVGGGLTHAEVADVLFISPATVRKHMEHVRERLGVHSAAAAAALALPFAPPLRPDLVVAELRS